MKKRFQLAKAIYQQHGGILRSAEARRLGVSSTTIAELSAAGDLIKESTGVYRLASHPELAYPDLVTVALRVPYGVVCLISALHFHELTTQIPHQIYLALPRNRTKAPRIGYPPLHIVTLGQNVYAAGVETHVLDGVPVKIYSMEKTIADCFKFRSLIGQDVALEALKTYFAEHKPNIPELLRCAQLDRVEKLIRPYLELLQ